MDNSIIFYLKIKRNLRSFAIISTNYYEIL